MVVSEEVEVSDLAHDIHIHFLTHNLTWSGNEEPPSPEQIQQALDWLTARLEKEADNSTIFGGRLAVTKSGKHRDVFVHFGEING